jgi:hypothetical protein
MVAMNRIERQSRAQRINAKRGVEVTLPDLGEPVLLRRAGLAYLMQNGSLPDSLTPMVNEMISATEGRMEADSGEIANRVLMTLDNVSRVKFVVTMYNATLMACGVDPVFVEEVKDEAREVSVHDISYVDKEFVFIWAQGGSLEQITAQFRSIRPEQGGDVAAVAEGEGLLEDPVITDDDKFGGTAAPGVVA